MDRIKMLDKLIGELERSGWTKQEARAKAIEVTKIRLMSTEPGSKSESLVMGDMAYLLASDEEKI